MKLKVSWSLNLGTQIALNAVNVMFLAYLVIYAQACPSPALLSAVSLELGIYGALLGYRIWRSTKPKSSDQISLDNFEKEWQTFGRLRNSYRVGAITVSAVVALYMLADFSALIAAYCGNHKLANSIYSKIAIAPSSAIHPGLSMELLAGAYIESKNYKRAEPLELSVLALDKSLTGDSELVAAMEANLGDLYTKEFKFADAEQSYLKAIQSTKRLRLPQGFGSPMTRLGTLYAVMKKFDKAQKCFDSAAEIRSRIFGEKSVKVAETLKANVAMLEDQQRFAEAKVLKDRIKQTSTPPAADSAISATVVPVVVSAASLLALWKRDRIILFAAQLAKSRVK